MNAKALSHQIGQFFEILTARVLDGEVRHVAGHGDVQAAGRGVEVKATGDFKWSIRRFQIQELDDSAMYALWRWGGSWRKPLSKLGDAALQHVADRIRVAAVVPKVWLVGRPHGVSLCKASYWNPEDERWVFYVSQLLVGLDGVAERLTYDAGELGGVRYPAGEVLVLPPERDNDG